MSGNQIATRNQSLNGENGGLRIRRAGYKERSSEAERDCNDSDVYQPPDAQDS